MRGFELPQATNSIVGSIHFIADGRLGSEAAVLGRGLVAGLPGTVHLVAEAPELEAVRIGRAVGDTQVAPTGAARVVAVFEQVAGGVETAGAEVDGHVDVGPGELGPAGEFVGADRVGLGREPGEIETGRPVGNGADSVFPLVPGDEIAAGVADERDAEGADQFEDIAAEAVLIGGRVAGFVDTAVDGPPEVLEEAAVQARVDLADVKIRIEDDVGGVQCGLLGNGPLPPRPPFPLPQRGEGGRSG